MVQPAAAADVARRPLRQWLGGAWQLLRPYWVSEDRWPARALLALIIATDLLRTYVAVRVTYWQRDYWDALAAHDVGAFWQLMWVFVVIICFSSVFDTARIWFFQMLEMRWRAWLTEVFVGRWLDDRAFYRIARAGGIDNPDQRIGEDLQLLASDSLRLSLGMLDSLVKLFSYSAIVWSLSGSLSFALGGIGIEIPGYLLWVAVLYALLGSLLLEKIGHPLVRVDYHQQRCEAHFRYLMMRVRENAEQIAFYSGGRAETVRLRAAFTTIRENWRRIMDYTKRITLFHESYIELGAFLPLLIIGPRYFAGAITLGAVQQLTLSFSRVRGALSWFIFAYKDLALLRSAFQRLLEFEAAMGEPEQSGIALARSPRPDSLRVAALNLRLPDGTPLAHIDDLEMRAGERWLIRGPSGVGKSTLLRALAGLWPHGSGEIAMPAGREMFLPQQSYLPIGSLRACLCYPSDEQWFGIGECIEVLRAVRLESLADELDVHDNWTKRLSPGEQQRLAFARVLLHKPDWLFLDEATASLDPRNEALLYRLLIERLPGLTVVSVAHRESLAAFHTRVLELADGHARIADL
ncbi:ABC transporter ATP-binding protein/permease [Pseudothauera rhizosphaerae]|uniref:ABC transporter ATP-binding protein/permease n=2 Tax=Pseudothauera rhizosphaerae TaxID=2565932 RepID=A0A4V3WC16_9RHOO|nr:ABC transporter ATP-binding protein/permease [Pseudothauera rhizosphaerae]